MTVWDDRDLGRSASSRRTRRFDHGFVELAKQIFFVVLGALFYFGVRGLTEGSPHEAVRRGREILEWERRLGIDIEQRAQDLITDSDTLVTLANWVYIWLHWPIIILTLLWLHRTRRLDYLILRNAMFVSGAIGLVIFALYPVAPPRLADPGFVDTVTELSKSYRILQPPALVNKYAAVPSLHVGWNLLVGIAVYRAATRWWLRALAAAGPAAMTAAVIFTANHYVIDAVAGAAVALAGLAIATPFTIVWHAGGDADRSIETAQDRESADDSQSHPNRSEPENVSCPYKRETSEDQRVDDVVVDRRRVVGLQGGEPQQDEQYCS